MTALCHEVCAMMVRIPWEMGKGKRHAGSLFGQDGLDGEQPSLTTKDVAFHREHDICRESQPSITFGIHLVQHFFFFSDQLASPVENRIRCCVG